MGFFLETLFGGLMAGMLYSLIALGFVLIYKASGVFNFAQGSMVFFAALTFVSLLERGWNLWLPPPAAPPPPGGVGPAPARHRPRPPPHPPPPPPPHAAHPPTLL